MHMPKDVEVMYREGCKTECTNLGKENRHTSTNKRVGYVEKGCYSTVLMDIPKHWASVGSKRRKKTCILFYQIKINVATKRNVEKST